MDNQEKRDINLALLIDVDNVSSSYIERVLSELSNYGKITIRRMYGDVEGFCIVSSDSDFNRLATRIREAGMLVIGMGEKKTPASFRASCERFIFLDVLEDASDEDEKDEKALTADDVTGAGNDDTSSDVVPKSSLEKTIINMINDNAAAGKETLLSEIGSRLLKIYPDFDTRSYNYSRLSSFVNDFETLEVHTENNRTYVSLRVSTLGEIEEQIASIYKKSGAKVMNIGSLHNELQKMNPSLSATIRQSGVTKFSTFLERKIPGIRIVNNTEAEFTAKKKASGQTKPAK